MLDLEAAYARPSPEARTGSKQQGTFFARVGTGTPGCGNAGPNKYVQSLLMVFPPSRTQSRLRRRLSKLWLAQYLFKATLQHIFLGASAWNINLKARNKGSSAMVVPVRRRLRTKTPAAAVQRIPSMELVRRRVRSKGPPPQPKPQLWFHKAQEERWVRHPQEEIHLQKDATSARTTCTSSSRRSTKWWRRWK